MEVADEEDEEAGHCAGSSQSATRKSRQQSSRGAKRNRPAAKGALACARHVHKTPKCRQCARAARGRQLLCPCALASFGEACPQGSGVSPPPKLFLSPPHLHFPVHRAMHPQ